MKVNAPRDDLTREFVLSKLTYDPETGEVRWIRPKGGTAKPGGLAGFDHLGYRRVKLGRYSYMMARVIWLMHYGVWPGPDKYVDHINLDRSDDRIVNLRLADHYQNTRNVPSKHDGLKGTSFKAGRWRARITHNKKPHLLGVFDTEQEAHAAYVKAAAQLHGEFARSS